MNKLDRLKEYKQSLAKKEIVKALDGAKLELVPVSKDGNILPTGEYHKNKHDLDLPKDKVTEKGIPVITVDDDSAESFAEIKAQEDSIQLHAEIELHEVIFNKEVTDYLEEKRKEYHESHDSDILLEVGKRITKELLLNTKDKDAIIEKISEHEQGTI